MSLAVYLNFEGNAREAIAYYCQVFGFTDDPKIITYGVSSDPKSPLPAEAKDLIMNAQIYIHGGLVMFSDVFIGMPFTQGNNVSLTIISQDENEVRTLFEKLSEGGSVQMELQDTGWSPLYGAFVDKFGINWQVNYDAERAYA